MNLPFYPGQIAAVLRRKARRYRVAMVVLILCAGWPTTLEIRGQEARVNHRKIERERERKKKQALREYNDAVKRHNKMQSKTTRASMKKTKKEAKKVTPVRR